MQGRNLNLAVGAFVLLGLIALLFMALQVSNLGAMSNGPTYEVKAYFDNIGGLKQKREGEKRTNTDKKTKKRNRSET